MIKGPIRSEKQKNRKIMTRNITKIKNGQLNLDTMHLLNSSKIWKLAHKKISCKPKKLFKENNKRIAQYENPETFRIFLPKVYEEVIFSIIYARCGRIGRPTSVRTRCRKTMGFKYFAVCSVRMEFPHRATFY